MRIHLLPLLLAAIWLPACARDEQRASTPEPVPAPAAAQAAPATPPPADMPAATPAAPAGATPAAHAALSDTFQKCVDAAAGVTPDTQACIEAEAARQQARLDTALASARKHGDAAAQATLAREQADWTARKAADCKWDGATEGQGQRLDANMCDLQAVADRADALAAHHPAKD